MIEGLWGWLLELLAVVRRQLFWAALTLAVASLGGYLLAPTALRTLIGPGRAIHTLVFLSPAEAFIAELKLAVALGFVGALPVLAWLGWQAARPFLPPHERHLGWRLVPCACLLFYLGAGFAFFGMIPMAMRFLLGFENSGLQPMISVASYVSFLIWMVFPTAVAFETPILAWALTRAGLLRPAWLVAKRKYAVLLIFIVAAIFTPADVFSQFAMALPMLAVYEVCVIVSRLSARGRARREALAAPWAEDGKMPS